MSSPAMARARRLAGRLSSLTLTPGANSSNTSSAPPTGSATPSSMSPRPARVSLESAASLSAAAAATAAATAAAGFFCGHLAVEVVSARGITHKGHHHHNHPQRHVSLAEEGNGLGGSGDSMQLSTSLSLSPSGSSPAPGVAVVLQPRPEARPKKARTTAQQSQGGGVGHGPAASSASLTVPTTLALAWHERVEFDLRRVDVLVVTVRETGRGRGGAGLGETLARGELTLRGLRLEQGAPVTVDVPLTPQGELRLVLAYTDAAPLFGLDLAAVCSREDDDVPAIVRKCCAAVEDYGLDQEGIYRIPGNKPVIDALARAFIEDAKGVTLSAHDVLHINNVASLLKQYLQTLPEPVMTCKASPLFLQALALPDGAEKEARFAELLMGLPPANRSTSIFLLTHMLAIARHSRVNKMEPSNLAICFGPTMLSSEGDHDVAALTKLVFANKTARPSEELLQSLRQPRGDNEVIRFLLTHPNVLQRCQRELKLKSANTSLAELDASGLLIPGSSASLELEVEPQRHTLFQFQQLDRLHMGQLTCRALRLLCFEKGRLLGRTEATIVFRDLCGNLDGVSWPTFRSWWDMVAHQPLSPEARESLTAAVRFFRHYADVDDRTASTEAGSRMLQALHDANPHLAEYGWRASEGSAKADAETVTLDHYLHWLVSHGVL